ncbi:MAG: hypothetical protein GY851_29720 [bacterium]|nr:hypothetical protein [bacterium]
MRILGISRQLAVLAAIVALSGCTRLGDRFVPGRVPEGYHPELRRPILDDLRANDEAIRSFAVSGTCAIDAPELRRRLRGNVKFRKPDSVHIAGREAGLGAVATPRPVLEVTSVGSDFLVDIRVPGQKERYFSIGEERSEGMDLSFDPNQLAREMFFLLPWDKLRLRHLDCTGYDEQTQTATVEIHRSGHPRRVLEVTGVPWVIASSTLYDAEGAVVAQTTMGKYRTVDGVRFPSLIECEFPSDMPDRPIRLKFSLKTIDMNPELDDDVFQFDWTPGAP